MGDGFRLQNLDPSNLGFGKFWSNLPAENLVLMFPKVCEFGSQGAKSFCLF